MTKRVRRFIAGLALAFGVAAGPGAQALEKPLLPEKAPQSISMVFQKAACFDGKVSKILVDKSDRKMELLDNKGDVLRAYDIALGTSPVGDKVMQGDNKTPEGDYVISAHNPNSAFTLSLRISYPNAQDCAAARKLGVDPGGDIFIHGAPTGYPDDWKPMRVKDWTEGCIALKNGDIREIYAAVKNGTPVTIKP